MYSPFNNTMTGPGGTKYTVVAKAPNGAIGVADLGNNSFRVRVEVTADNSRTVLNGNDWSQPSSSNRRFSVVVPGEKVAARVLEGRQALKEAEKVPVFEQIKNTLTAAGFAS